MKYLKTNLAGKVRNLPAFKSEALMPLFEAVINSIQAIEERGNLPDGTVTVTVLREQQGTILDGIERAIVGFTIDDNGIGFDDENFESFQTSETAHKEAKGGKGIGRFLWLKAFDRVEIDSTFKDGAKFRRRKFAFSVAKGIGDGKPSDGSAPQATTISLIGFKKEYRRLPSAYKTTPKIAQRILEHCLSYFVSGNAPRIVVKDSETSISLNDEFEEKYKDNITPEVLTLKKHEFRLIHIKLYNTHDQMHNIVLCADNRDVMRISLARVLGTSTQFDEDDRRFTYVLYVTSAYLDKHADHYRLDFDLLEDDANLLDSSAVSKKTIVDAVSQAAKSFLAEHLARARQRTEEKVANYVATENPALRSVPTYCPEIYDELEPSSSPDRIDEVLHHYKGKTEYNIRKKSEELLKSQVSSLAEIDDAYAALTTQITDVQKDNLVQYLCDRQRIIKLLERKLEINRDGTYANEDIVHDVVFPRKASTDDIRYEDHNLWLIDEVLAFHAFAASEMAMKESIDVPSDGRPDIIAFAEVGDDKVARAVSIIEFKKPQRTNFDEDPTRQLFRYLRKVKDAKRVKLPNGRELHVADDTRYYCYAICDLTPAIRAYAEDHSFTALMGEFGYYTYNPNHNAHTELLHFDKLVVDAKRRHKAFFSKLGIG